jgi:hypothetical protein
MFFLFSCFLEICVVVERSLYFLPKKYRNKAKNLDFNKLILALFSFCVIIHVPLLFFFAPAYADVQLDKSKWYRIWYTGVVDFSYTLTGKILT